MNFLALATDYDGTLAHDGAVDEDTVSALEKLRDSGRKLILVSGRILDDFLRVFPRPDLFEWIVVENGALLYCPNTRQSRLLTDPVPPGFTEALLARGVTNLGVGQAIVGTWVPHQCQVLETLREMGLDRQIIFNKDAVMILPTGVNKATGLLAALAEMKLSPHNVVAVGDAENDLPMLALAECGVAVSNALESVKARADLVMHADHGAGVQELISELLSDDLVTRLGHVPKQGLLLGWLKTDPGKAVLLPRLGRSILVAGPSGSGKSTAITGLLERLAEAEYQFCLFDPEGDYEGFEPAVNFGNPHYVPGFGEVVTLLERMHSVVVNLLGVSLDNRPEYVSEMLRSMEALRSSKGRPHWLILDEAHHLFPTEVSPGSPIMAEPPRTSLMITVHPKHLRREALLSADILIAVGKDPDETVRDYCRTAGIAEPPLEPVTLEKGEVLFWFRPAGNAPVVVTVEPGKTEHKRHIRKYAEGDLGPVSFVFRGADEKLSLCAQNFSNFMRIGSGVDDQTWDHHLHAHDYSNWIRSVVKDFPLAEEVEGIENGGGTPTDTREQIFDAIRQRYTAPA